MDAFVLAIEKISVIETKPGLKARAPAGQCYCISDGTPIDNFEFLKPLCEARIRLFPTFNIPLEIMLSIAFVLEVVHFALCSIGIPNSPFLTRSEVHKVGVTHFFSMDKARSELGYKPAVTSKEGINRVANYYRYFILYDYNEAQFYYYIW